MEVVIQMDDSIKILELLDSKKNVLLMGAPGTGKSHVMNKVAEAFINGGTRLDHPSHVPGASVPIPAVSTPRGLDLEMLKNTRRKVFRTTLHQNSKYRDFLTGIVPDLDAGGYHINEGILYRANEFAKQDNSAALLIIDELNRGPAIEVFGGSIVAIESDKRLNIDNTKSSVTQYFEILNPKDGKMIEYAFSPKLYILAAMNQADVSVAPLDVAFMRRWQSYHLEPDYNILYDHFGVDSSQPVPSKCVSASDVYSVAIHALEKINESICIGRGKEYQLGQGVFLTTQPKDGNVSSALQFVSEVWSMIYAHIDELFFGDNISISYVVNANSPLSPYKLEDFNFAGEAKSVLTCKEIGVDNIFDLYQAIARREQ